MKLLQKIIVSPLQLKTVMILWLILLLFLGINMIFSMIDTRRNFFETVRWRSETLAYKLLGEMTTQIFSGDDSAKGEEGLQAVSSRLQGLIEQYHDHTVTQISIIDATGYWVAHSEKVFRNTPVKNQALLQYLNSQEKMLVSDSKMYHTLLPFFDQQRLFLGIIDIGVSKGFVEREIWSKLYKHVGIFLVFVCLVSGLFLLYTRHIFQSFHEILSTSTMIAAGDLTPTKITVRGSGEIRRLTLVFREMADNLRGITLQVQHAGELIRSVTQDMLAATDRLAVAFEQQSASVGQTSVNMESVVLASQQISKSTDNVVQIAEKTRTDAQQGLQVAEDTLKKMQDIQQSNQTDTENIQNLGLKSKEISKIMDVIVSIADQTKLIAFNASLEAAGAGTTGRRFGVIAKEIRTLADHVIGSTTSIRQMIADIQISVHKLINSSETSTENIMQGTEYTVLTAEWLKEILSGTTQTTRVAQRISRSILKQQLTSEEISSALKELLHNTDEFAKTGILTREIAGRLDIMTKELEEKVKTLKV